MSGGEEYIEQRKKVSGVKITVNEGPGDGDPPITIPQLVAAEDLVSAYDEYRAIEELEHLRTGGIEFVGGEGALDAPIMIIGEAPGEQENAQQRPFVGPAGVHLREQLDRIGLTSSEVFITNVVKYRPPDNRTPLFFEVELSRKCVDAEIDIVRPDLIILAGRTALSLIHHAASIGEHQGLLRVHDDRLYLPIYHPSAALRDAVADRAFQAAFDLVETILHG